MQQISTSLDSPTMPEHLFETVSHYIVLNSVAIDLTFLSAEIIDGSHHSQLTTSY